MSILAYDLGASSGRAVLGRLTDRRIEMEELHRFPNEPVQIGSRLHWDILRLFQDVKQALVKAKLAGIHLESIGFDSWAVDFGMIGRHGELLGNPYHYRDEHTKEIMEHVFREFSKEFIFAQTGIQFLPFNTIYQLVALKQANSPLWDETHRLLMIPDLLRYFLTGEMYNEFTNATTTQLYHPLQDQWCTELFAMMGIPSEWFRQPVKPGTFAGHVRQSVQQELGVSPIPVIAVAEHDTGSAVAAVPALTKEFAYLSCGTWSLMGTEIPAPILTAEALRYNFTNEGGVNHTFRFLKNIMGLWILQETKRAWELHGIYYSFTELVKLAERAPAFTAWIDPDDERFLPPGDMGARIRKFCQETNQPIPQDAGEFTRCILESLALKYRYIFELTQKLTNQTFNNLHMVGGGIQNNLLCQFTANAIGKSVLAGPIEASAIGNLVVQWMNQGIFRNMLEARKVIHDSFPIQAYEPTSQLEWEEAYYRFVKVCKLDSVK